MPFVRYLVAAFTSLMLLLAVAGFWPVARETDANVSAPIPEDGVMMMLNLDAPKEVRQGTTDLIHLTTRLDGLTGSAPNLPPATQTVVNVDSTCVVADPPDETLQAALLNQTQTWTWQLSPLADTGPCEVDVVVRLRNDADERIVWVKQMQITTPAVLGLPAPTAQGLGLSGSVLGFLGLAILQLRLYFDHRKRP